MPRHNGLGAYLPPIGARFLPPLPRPSGTDPIPTNTHREAMNLTYNMALGAQMMGVLLVVAGMVAGHLLKKQETTTLRSQQQNLEAAAKRARDHLDDPNAP